MFPTIRRLALALAGAAALVAAGRARADHEFFPPPARPPAYSQEDGLPPAYQDYRVQPQPGEVYRPEAYSPPLGQPGLSLSFSAALPPPPVWLAMAPPPVPGYGTWTRHQLEREYRWLDMARVRFYRFGAASPWRVRQFEAWYQLRRAGLDRRWMALAWAPGPRHGWRGAGWDGRGGEGRGRGWGRERDERD